MTIRLSLTTLTSDGKLEFTDLPATYPNRRAAMVAAKRAAGRGARYTGDGLSIRYSGANGTVYLCVTP